MNIEIYSRYADVIAIIGFLALIHYFYKKEKRTTYENILFLFVIAGFIIDLYLSLYRFVM